MPDNVFPFDNSDAIAFSRGPEPDAHGQAALLLCESVLHGLIRSGVLSLAQAVDIVETAKEVKKDVAKDYHETLGRLRQSLRLLSAVEQSLNTQRNQDGGIGRT